MHDSSIAEILQREDGEDEVVSETEDYEEHSNHDSDTEQEADFDDVPDIPMEFEEEHTNTKSM